MQKHIQNWLTQNTTKTFNTADLLTHIEIALGSNVFIEKGGYEQFAKTIMKLTEENRLAPVAASKTNRRNPALYNRYRKVSQTSDTALISEELMLLHPGIKIDYYLSHPEAYKKEKDYVRVLDCFLKEQSGGISGTALSINERSYQIFKNEKFLLSGEGKEFIKHVGLDFERLNCFNTYEPFFYISYGAKDGGNALIVENKDTFYTIKNGFAEDKRTLEGVSFDLLIYGEGKKILKSMDFFNEIPEYRGKKPCFYYFGDIDYEGIGIFQQLREGYGDFWIEPHVFLYEKLMEAGEAGAQRMPKNQRTVDCGAFLDFFSSQYKRRIETLLGRGLYIPQEALSALFFRAYLR